MKIKIICFFLIRKKVLYDVAAYIIVEALANGSFYPYMKKLSNMINVRGF